MEEDIQFVHDVKEILEHSMTLQKDFKAKRADLTEEEY